MMSGFLLFLNIGTPEMLVIVFVALLLFGGKKLPELARGLGRGIRDFKDASESIKQDINDQINNFDKDLDIKDTEKGKKSGDSEQSQTPSETPKLDQQVEVREPSPEDYSDIGHSDQYYHNYDYSDPDQAQDTDQVDSDTVAEEPQPDALEEDAHAETRKENTESPK